MKPNPATTQIHLVTFDLPDSARVGTERHGVLAWEYRSDGSDQRDEVYFHSAQDSRLSPRRSPQNGEDIATVTAATYPQATNIAVDAAALLPGEYHPRIWRNGISDAPILVRTPSEQRACFATDLPDLRRRVVAHHRIQKQLADIFEVATPVRANAATYGEAIGQVLALAAFEVEQLLREVYRLNSATGRGGNLKFKQLARELEPQMMLSEWEAGLSYYADWGTLRPFHGWSQSAPAWWRAYNDQKHSSSGAQTSTLANAISCVVANRILLQAEFGPFVRQLLPGEGIASIDVVTSPSWALAEQYFPPSAYHRDGTCRPKQLFA
jgi:hypothetical protein